MARRRDRARVKGQAISLFLSGMSLADVSQALSISLRTLSRWRGEDAAAGADWDTQRSRGATWSPEALLGRVRELIGEVLGDRSRAPEATADIVSKLVSAQDRLAGQTVDAMDPGLIMRVLGDELDWARSHMSAEEHGVLVKAFGGYTQEIKDMRGG